MNAAAVVEMEEDRWAHQINAALRKSVQGILEVGRLLIEAKADLDHGQFGDMVKKKLPFSHSTANRLMKIASHPVLSDSANSPILPTSWNTLYEISKHDPIDVRDAIRHHRIKPDTTSDAVVELFRKRRTSRKAKPGSPPSFSAYLRKTLGPSNWMALQQLDEMSAEVLCNIICPEILKVIGRDEG